MTNPDMDRIERTAVLRAPRSRVWRALTDWKEFSRWFGVDMKGPFTPGARVAGDVLHPDYAHLLFDIVVDRVEPERYFSWHWIPGAMEPGKDYSGEPMTHVSFTLEDCPEGTIITVVETGFHRIPAERRGNSYRENSEGWDEQMENIKRYVSKEA